MSFSDKLMGKVEENKIIQFKCDNCSKCKQKYFMKLNINLSNNWLVEQVRIVEQMGVGQMGCRICGIPLGSTAQLSDKNSKLSNKSVER